MSAVARGESSRRSSAETIPLLFSTARAPFLFRQFFHLQAIGYTSDIRALRNVLQMTTPRRQKPIRQCSRRSAKMETHCIIQTEPRPGKKRESAH
jgi:hypothetical protein